MSLAPVGVKERPTISCPDEYEPRGFGSLLRQAMAYNVATKVVQLGGTVVAARILGPTQYGASLYLLTTVQMASSVVGLSLPTAATRYIASADTRSDQCRISRQFTKLSLAFSAFVAATLLTLISSNLLPVISVHDSTFATIATILTIHAFAFSLMNNAVGQLYGIGLQERALQVQLGAASVSVCGMLLAAPALGNVGYIFAVMLSSVVGAVTAYRWVVGASREDVAPISCSTSTQTLQEILRFALPLTLSSMTSLPVIWLANTILLMQGTSAGDLGGLLLGNQLFNLVTFFPTGLTPTLLLAYARHNGDLVTQARLVRQHSLIAIVAALVGGTLCVLLINDAMAIFGQKFEHFAAMIAVLLGSAFIQIAKMPLIVFLQARGAVWIDLYGNLGWAASVIVGTLLLGREGVETHAWLRFGCTLAQAIFIAVCVAIMLRRALQQATISETH